MEKSFITSGPGYCCSLSTNSADIEASSETFSTILVLVIVDFAVLSARPCYVLFLEVSNMLLIRYFESEEQMVTFSELIIHVP